jgi:hypothetical protein
MDNNAKPIAIGIEGTAEAFANGNSFNYQPSPKEQEVVTTVFRMFQRSSLDRNRSFQYFDNRNIIDYINDSVRRFVTGKDERDDIEDWQARVFDPFTRNKLLAILGKVLEILPVAELVGRGDQNLIKAEIMNTLLEYSDDQDEAEEFFVYFIQEALVKGTAIGYEGIEVDKKKVRDVVQFVDQDNYSVQEDTITARKLVSKIVPLEEFYPSSVGVRSIKDMSFCFTRREVPYDQFQEEYKNFARAKNVLPYQQNFGRAMSGPRPFYKDYISPNTLNGNVEIITYYNRDTDEYVLISNGMWLNPLGNDTQEIVAPIPFNHKTLPFYEVKYDILGSDFFYGKSFPDKLKVMQDVLNVLENMMLDQSFLSIFKPILVNGADDIDDDFLRPGRRIPVDTGGLPIQQAYQQLDIGTPNGWHEFILNYTRKIMEESSMDALQQGVAGVGGRTTAQEIRTAASGVAATLGLFARFLKFGAKRRTVLRAKNILQFYFDPKFPIYQSVLGGASDKMVSKAFNVFQVDSMPYTPGNRGTKIIEVYAEKKDMPTKVQQKVNARLDEIESGKKVTRIAITPEFIRGFDFWTRFVPNPKSDTSNDIERALEIQFQQTMLSLYGSQGILDMKEMAAELITKFGKDPAKILNEQALTITPPAQPGQQGAQSMTPNQGGDNSANTVKGATGVGSEAVALKYIMQGNSPSSAAM